MKEWFISGSDWRDVLRASYNNQRACPTKPPASTHSSVSQPDQSVSKSVYDLILPQQAAVRP